MATPPSISDLPAYLWEVPEKPISVHLHYDVIDRLSPEVMRGLGALKRRGAEVGGLLLGRLESPQNVVVEDFEPIASEYLTGPSYSLSPNDLVSFEAAIGRRRPDGRSVVGFYRSHTRDDLFLADADVALANRYFRDASNVILLIRPFATRTSIGGFFIWEDGEIHRESSYQQFPFSRIELGGGEIRHSKNQRPAPVALPTPMVRQDPPQPKLEPPLQQRVDPPPPPRIDPPPAPRIDPPPPPPQRLDPPPAPRQDSILQLRIDPPPPPVQQQEPPARVPAPVREPEPVVVLARDEVRSSDDELPPSIFSYEEEEVSRTPSWKWMLVPAFICLAVTGAYFGYRSLINSKPSVAGQSSPSNVLPLKLSVAEKQDQLDITWDRNAPAIAQAIQGVLTIIDGGNKRDLTLNTTQLKNGRVRYRRLSGDVALRLEVFPEGQEGVSESIRIVLADPTTTAPESKPAEPAVVKSDAVKSDAVKSDAVKSETPKPVVPNPASKSIAVKSEVAPPAVVKPAETVKTPPAKSEVVRPAVVTKKAAAKTTPAAAAPPTVEAAPPPAVQPQAPPPEVELQRPERRR